MYDLTIIEDSEQSGLSYVPTGINENLRLGRLDGTDPIVYKKLENGNEFIAFNFINDEKQTFVHTEWVPSSDDANILAKKQKNLSKRLFHIAKKLVDESQLKFKAETFGDLCTKLITAIGDNYKDKLFRCKVIYNNKNYTTFPNYVPFIESMDIPTEKSKLRMSLDDKVVKSKADTLIVTTPNPFVANAPGGADETYAAYEEASDASMPKEGELPF